jgi:excisionase family DNA binding protein
MQVDRHYTVQQAADLVGLSEDGVLALIHNGELPASNVARSKDSKRPSWRISEGDLGRLLLARRHPANTKTKVVRRPHLVTTREFF